MRRVRRMAGLVALFAGCVAPAVALAAHPKSDGNYVGQSQRDGNGRLAVNSGGKALYQSYFDCQKGEAATDLQGTVIVDKLVKISHNGSFAYHGKAYYDPYPSGTLSHPVVSFRGRFVTRTKVTGVEHGPGECKTIHFTFHYTSNP